MFHWPNWFVDRTDAFNTTGDLLYVNPMQFVQEYIGEILVFFVVAICTTILWLLWRDGRRGKKLSTVGELEMSGLRYKTEAQQRRVRNRRIVSDGLEEMFLNLTIRKKDNLTPVEAEAWKQRIGKLCGLWDLLPQTLPATQENAKERLLFSKRKRELNELNGGTPNPMPIPNGTPKTASELLNAALKT